MGDMPESEHARGWEEEDSILCSWLVHAINIALQKCEASGVAYGLLPMWNMWE